MGTGIAGVSSISTVGNSPLVEIAACRKFVSIQVSTCWARMAFSCRRAIFCCTSCSACIASSSSPWWMGRDVVSFLLLPQTLVLRSCGRLASMNSRAGQPGSCMGTPVGRLATRGAEPSCVCCRSGAAHCGGKPDSRRLTFWLDSITTNRLM